MVHEVTYSEDVQTRVRFKAGKIEESSCLCIMGGSNRGAGCTVAIFEDVVCLKVPPGVENVEIALINDKNRNVLAECTVSTESLKVQRTMMLDMATKNPGKSLISKVPCIFMSWKVDGADESDTGVTSTGSNQLPCLTSDSDASEKPLGVIRARAPMLLKGMETEKMNEDLRSSLESSAADRQRKLGAAQNEMSDKCIIRSQLEMLAEIAQGWLICELVLPTGTGEIKMFYKLYHSESNKGYDRSGIKVTLSSWKLGWWTEENGLDQAAKGSIPVLAVSQIYGVVNDKNAFILVYLDTTEGTCVEQALRLTCPNGGRDQWVEALQSFIKRLRAFRHQEQVDFFNRNSSKGKPIRNTHKDNHGSTWLPKSDVSSGRSD
jgi:hypothetical protein